MTFASGPSYTSASPTVGKAVGTIGGTYRVQNAPSLDEFGNVITDTGSSPAYIYQTSDGKYYVNTVDAGRAMFLPVNGPNMLSIPASIAEPAASGSMEVQRQAAQEGPDFMEQYGVPLMLGAMTAGAAGWLGPGVNSLAGGFGSVVGAGATDMSLGAAGTGYMTLPGEAGLVFGGGEAAATGAAASKGLIDTALTGAGRSAAINGAVQFATTGKIDPGKLAISGVAGGFGGVLGDIVGGATGMPFAGQVAGAVTGAVVGGALSGGGAAASGAVGGGTSTSGGSSGAPTVNPSNLSFNNPGLIDRAAPRSIDWSTPRLNWSGA